MRIKILYAFLFMSIGLFELNAQSSDNYAKGVVVDINNKPIANISVFSTKSKKYAVTDKEGRFTLSVKPDDYIKIDESGYKKSLFSILQLKNNKTIVLKPWNVAIMDEKLDISYGKQNLDRMTGAVTVVDGKDLVNGSSFNMLEALTGRVGGLRVTPSGTNPEGLSFGSSLRGGGIYTMLDNTPTSIASVRANEVDNVVILKDLGGTLLFGGSATNSAMFVNTKRGHVGEKAININYRHGIQEATFLPKVMNSLQYAKLLDAGLRNDGLPERYGESAYPIISSGSDPMRYPNVDYYDMFLDKSSSYDKVNANFTGAGKYVRYFSTIDYYAPDGLEKFNKTTSKSLSTRSNLLVDATSFIHFDLGIGGYLNSYKRSNYYGSDLFNAIRTIPSIAMPLIVGYDENKAPIFGVTRDFGTNLLSENAYRGTTEGTGVDAFTRIGTTIDLDGILKGLKFNGCINLSVSSSSSKRIQPTVNRAYPDYQFNPETGEEEFAPLLIAVGKSTNSWGKVGDYTQRNNYYSASLNYDTHFGIKHQLTADLAFNRFLGTGSTYQQDSRKQSLGMRLNYFYNNKYVVEGSVSRAGVQSLDKDNRINYFYNGGLAWIVSRENFLKDSKFINYLKLRANYGETGVYFGMVSATGGDQDSRTYYLYQDAWTNDGSYGFGEIGAQSSSGAAYRKRFTGSTNLKWPKRQYLDIGTDFRLFNNKVNGQINYFRIVDYDQIYRMDCLTALMSNTGVTDYMPFMNYTKYTYNGFDIDLSYKDNIGDFSYLVGANMYYKKQFVNQALETLYPEVERYRNSTGNNGGRQMGLSSDGLFQTQQEVDEYNSKYNSRFGDIHVGDIRYVDFNNDGEIDNKDVHRLAWGSRMNYGAYLNIGYKGLSLFMRGEGVPDGKYFNSTMRVSGMSNYRVEQAEAWPATNNLPRASVMGSVNNNRNSDFWLRSAAYFNMKNITLSYKLPTSFSKKLFMENMNIYASGNNLFVISPDNKDRYMVSGNKGVSEYPVMRSLELGLEVTF